MTSVTVTGKQIREFCTPEVEMQEAIDHNGDHLYVKFLRIQTIDELNISECLEFNRCVLGDPEPLLFPQHFLKIEEELANEAVVGFVTQPYSQTLYSYIKGKTLSEKDALVIFDQLLKAVYSLYYQGYPLKNIRSQHFVLRKKIWKLESLVFSQDYEQANGISIEYLWSPKHQAPECFGSNQHFNDEDFEKMVVWNLGSILVELLLGNHKFATLQTMLKFKDQPFTFEALGIGSTVTNRFSAEIKQSLSQMLHFDSKARAKLTEVFANRFLSSEVAKHYEQHKQHVPLTKIATMKSSIKQSAITAKTQQALVEVQKTLEENQINKMEVLLASKASRVIDQYDFLEELGAISTRIPANRLQHKPSAPLQPEPQTIDQIMNCTHQDIRKALELYKSYFDQSELLMLALEVIQGIEFFTMTSHQVRELRMLINYAVTLVSLINLHALAEGFNQNRNLLDLDGNIYTAFQSCSEYSAFQKIVNFRRNQRSELLQNLRHQIESTKERPLLTNNPSLWLIIAADYKKTGFQTIKNSYRFIVKYAYDAICEQYNQNKNTDVGPKLAQTALYVIYCLTIDKLYIKEHISDNFKYYFEWLKQQPSDYVPLSSFKRYISEAPKETLIQHAKFVLKKYYNI